MAKITNRFVHFKTKASFTQRLGQGDIQESSVVFIQDANEIWTHGTYYKCNISRAEVEALITSKGYITEADIPSLTGGAAATSGQYVSGVTVSGHTVTVTKAALPSAATVAPKASGTADVGTSTKYAREDHVHPSQTTISGNAGSATKLATSRVIAIAGAVSGSATFDGSSNVSINSTLNNFDASKITSGTLNADRLPEIPISKIPAAALERLFVVESQSAAMSADVQEGDVVQIGSGGPMYFCVSESASTFATKFKEFTAGSATSVPWSGVTGKPTFATVATSGSYNDLTNKPTIPSLSGYATQNWVTSQGYLTSIPAATSSTYGGIQIGYATSGKNYAVQLSNGKAYVNVPWTDTNTTYSAGTNISISGTTINCTYSYTLPTATSSVLGGIKTGYQESGGAEMAIYTLEDGTAYTFLRDTAIKIALGFTPANVNDIPEIPIALPNPYALSITVGGSTTTYTGSSSASITVPKILAVTTLSSTTVSAGYNYNNTASRTISTLSGFSANNPDSVIISTAKLTFTASNAIKMDGLADLSGTYYIYCLSYMANGKVAVNGAVYA